MVTPFASVVCLGLWACGGSRSSPAVPIPDFLVASTPAGASTPCPAIGFDDAGAAAAPVTTYTRCGFTVTGTTPNWTVWTGYGKPAPFIGFMSAPGETTTGEIRVTAGAGKFTFQSVEVYSSTTPIPYVITGFANSAPVFAIQGTQGNTFGNFATISNPNPGAQ
ncbi:MAG: hypothetical protein ACXWLG_00760, partial [Myxococcaceae bacterium]